MLSVVQVCDALMALYKIMLQDHLHIAGIQYVPAWEKIAANLETLSGKISLCTDADIIVLPEMFSTGFTMNTDLAEPPYGPTWMWMKDQAAHSGKAICGSFIVREGAHCYNRFHFVRPDGQTEVYDKKHLFALAGEEKYYSPGSGRLVVEYLGWKIACLVCYDLRFPVYSRRTDDFDYDILLFVASWPDRRVYAWRSLLTARAIENQAYVFAVNRCGNDGQGVAHSGYSVALDYAGKPLAEALPFTEYILKSTFSHEMLQKFRTALPFWNERDNFRFI